MVVFLGFGLILKWFMRFSWLIIFRTQCFIFFWMSMQLRNGRNLTNLKISVFDLVLKRICYTVVEYVQQGRNFLDFEIN